MQTEIMPTDTTTKPRLMELIQLIVEAVSAMPNGSTLVAMAPVLELMIQNYETGKLNKLLTSCGEISKAVTNGALSEEEYYDIIVPLIQAVKEAL